MKLHITSILNDINAGNFTWTDEWERGWNAQPKPGTRYFVGTGKESVADPSRYNLQWQPRKRELTLWRGTDRKTVRFSPPTARRLSSAILRKFGETQAPPTGRRHASRRPS